MWIGLAILWAVFAIAVAVRWRRRSGSSAGRHGLPHHAERFWRDLRAAIDACDGVDLAGVVPGRFTLILSVDGQDTPIPMQPLQEHWRTFPFDLADVVKRVVEEVRADGLDTTGDFDFAELATDLMPQVRTMEWVRSHAPAFGDGKLVYRPLGPDLAVCYVIDDAWSMVFVCEEHLRRWRKAEPELFGLARRNLATRTDDDVRRKIANGEPISHRNGDGYAAARVLLLEPESATDLLVALPERDVLWLGYAADGDLSDLSAGSEGEFSASSKPVSPKLYRFDGGRFSEVGS